jgi:hypothetical protein
MHLSREFGRRAAITGLMTSTAASAFVGAAAWGIGQASANPGIAPPPAAPASSTYLTDRMTAFADKYAKEHWPDYKGGIMPAELPDYDTRGGGANLYVNPNNKTEQITVYCPNTGPCSGLNTFPKR